VGIVGMAAAAKPLAKLLAAFGATVLGYDPAVHASDALWARWGVEPLGLSELMESCDGVCVLLTYFSRYRGLLGERFLGACKPNQVLVSLAHSSLFDEYALAEALTGGRLAAAWFDSMEPGMLDPGRPLRHLDTLQVTPRVASTTLESRSRSAWAVARRIDELLGVRAEQDDVTPTVPGDLADLADGPAPV
jgi:phosphoglycerate dehydrogenase-like enzyme